MTVVGPVVLGLVVLWLPVAFCVAVSRPGRRGGVRDRRGIVDGLAGALLGVLLSWVLLPWGTLPELLWAVPVAVTGYGVLTAVPVWPGLPAVAGRWPVLKLAGTAGWVALTGLVGVVLIA